jgi:predicted MFS family arabinose efflux permease
MLGLADSPGSLIVARAVTGLAAAAWVPMVVAFNSLFPPREAVRATAMISLVSSGSQVLATSVTGSLNQWGGYSLAFFLAAGIACLGALLVWPAPERRRPTRRPSWQGTGRLITRQDVLLPSLLAAMSRYVNWATMFAFIPILANQLGGTDVTQSMLVTLYLGVTLLGILGATAIANRIGATWLVYTSFGLLAIGVGEAALAPSLPVLFFSPICLGLAQGVLNPVLMGMSIQYVADAERTTAMGLHQSVHAIGMFAGPWFSGILAEALGLRSMLGVTAVACLMLSYAMATRLTGSRQPERSD